MLGFGCRLNASETEAMAAALARQGVLAAPIEHADVVVINGCTITHEADKDAAAAIRRVHRQNPAARIIVTGCYAASSSHQAADLPGVVAVIGNAEKPDIVEVVGRALSHRGAPDVTVGQLRRGVPLRVLPPVADARARALLKIQDGCDYRCSFCIVPAVRGPSRSIDAPEILERARALVAAGVAEIVLTGVHLGTWGRDLGYGQRALGGLVEQLLAVLGPSRLRLSSIDPHEVDPRLVDLLAGEPRGFESSGRLCRHLHLPVQSCDDGVLSNMRRGHRSAQFVELAHELAAKIPSVAISTDVIAGFPGEDAAAFDRTRDTLVSLPLAYMHVFPYSVRHGTTAATMQGAVPAAVIRARAAALRAVSADHAARFRAAQIGRVVDLVVHLRPDRRGVWWAKTDHDLALRVGDASQQAGRRVLARVAADGEHAEIFA